MSAARERFADVLLDQQDRGSAGGDGADAGVDLRDQQRREAERGFVEHQQARAAHRAARDREHLLLAAGERRGALLQPFAQDRERGERRLEARAAMLRIAVDVRAEQQVVMHGRAREDAPAFGDVRDPAAHDAVRGDARDVRRRRTGSCRAPRAPGR